MEDRQEVAYGLSIGADLNYLEWTTVTTAYIMSIYLIRD